MKSFEKQLLAYQNLYHITEIPFIIASTSGSIVASYPEGSNEFYQADYWQNMPFGNIKGKHPNEPTLFEVGDFCYVAIIKLDTNLFLSTVPVRSTTQYPHSFFSTLKQGIYPDKQVEFYRFLLDVPAKTTYQLAEFASLCKMIYCNEPATGINIRHFAPDIVSNSSGEFDFRLTKENFVSNKHASLDFEKSLCDAITHGNEPALLQTLSRSLHGTIGRMSLNSLRQAKYEFICMAYASCRAAIAGGLSEEYAFNLSDSMCQKMDAMTDATEVSKYSMNCMIEFCHQVHDTSQNEHYSSYTHTCCDYITQHLFDAFTIDDLSREIGLNKKSLGQYFKKDTGLGIPEYILKKRLEEASYLLTNSNMDISSISELLQFSSQSHFTARFKKQFGVTPLQYRIT